MVFVDTSAFVARYIERDQYHKKGVTFWEKLQERRSPCWTSNFVLDEVFALLGRIAGNRFAYDRAQTIYDSRALSILCPDFGVERAAIPSNELQPLCHERCIHQRPHCRDAGPSRRLNPRVEL